MKKGIIAACLGAFLLIAAPVFTSVVNAETGSVLCEKDHKCKKACKKEGKTCTKKDKKKKCCAKKAEKKKACSKESTKKKCCAKKTEGTSETK